jgi:cyclase
MLRTRIIPILLLKDGGLVKTVKFSKERYIGDPINAVKIFNVKEADELVLLDISATKKGCGPNFDEIREIVSEAFMPIGYGGGISTLNQIEELFNLGVEKVILNSAAIENMELISFAADIFGSQSIVVSIDVKRNLFGGYSVYTHSGTKKNKMSLDEILKSIQIAGAGELVINSIDNDGMMKGYDYDLIKAVSSKIEIPLVCVGGAGSVLDFRQAISAGASAVGAGSMFIYQGVHKAVLISYVPFEQL